MLSRSVRVFHAIIEAKSAQPVLVTPQVPQLFNFRASIDHFALFATQGFTMSTILHVARPSLMLSLVLFSARTGRARTLVGMQQLAFCIYDMCILPACREHLTLYFNSLIAIQLMISAVSPSRGAWYLHGSAFITAHTMPVAYFILLDYTGDGPHARLSLQQYLRGFEVVDITQWAGVGRGVPGRRD